jgi:hypothetical protein
MAKNEEVISISFAATMHLRNEGWRANERENSELKLTRSESRKNERSHVGNRCCGNRYCANGVKTAGNGATQISVYPTKEVANRDAFFNYDDERSKQPRLVFEITTLSALSANRRETILSAAGSSNDH